MVKLAPILARYESSRTNRQCLSSYWREISDYARPVKQDIDIIGENTNDYSPSQGRLAAIFDTTAIDANRTYAAGCMAWMTPSETNWFSFDPPEHLAGDDSVKSWYSTCTDITRKILASSNFYIHIHECYLDDGAFGTCGMLIEEDLKDGLRFEALQIGEYSILENDKRQVDTLFREVSLTPRQAAEKFGEKKLHNSFVESLNQNKKENDLPTRYLHVIMPRKDADRIPGRLDGENMPWASIYIDMKHKHTVSESGTWEMPVAVHRHLLWSNLEYGFSPGMQALSDMRQLNLMQGYLDTLVEKHVSPPILAPHDFKGKIDIRAGGLTYFREAERKPQFWQQAGNPIIGEDRTVFRARQINSAFHVPLFQSLGEVPVGKEMTAAEVYTRERDSLILFSPTFARKNTELNTPIMKRVFGILLRGGAYPQAPPNLVQTNEEGMPFIPDPEIDYTSRIALKMKALHNESFTRTMQMAEPLFSINPAVADNVDSDSVFRQMYRNEGAPEDGLRPEREVEDIRRARAEQEAELKAQEDATMEAESLSKLGSAGLVQV